MQSSNLLNTKEAARFLRVSEASVRRWSDAGLLPARRVGRRRERRFEQGDLVKFLGQPARDVRPADPEHSPVLVGGAPIPAGSHIAPIYSTDLGRLRLPIPFLAEGLRAGQPCFLVADGGAVDQYANALRRDQAVDFDHAVRRGDLVIVDQPANVDAAIANWERLFGNALAGGPAVLRIVGEMACEREMFGSDGEMMAYEEAFDVMARRFPLVTLCQYDARKFDGEMLLRMLKAHPDMFEQHLGRFLN